MKTKTEIFECLKNVLTEEFELHPSQISPEKNLYVDLDLDSIDAIDLIARLQEITGKKIDPESFNRVQTIDDVTNAIVSIANQ